MAGLYKNTSFGPTLSSRRNKQTRTWDRSNLVAKYFLFFVWKPIFRQNIFELDKTGDEIFRPPQVDEAKRLTRRLERNFNNQLLLENRQPSFLRAMIKTFGPGLALIAILDVTAKCIMNPLQIIALGWIIRDTSVFISGKQLKPIQFDNQTIPTNASDTLYQIDSKRSTSLGLDVNTNIIVDGMLLIITTWLVNLLSHPYYFQSYHIGLKARIAACGVIYRKSLRLNQLSLFEATTGRLTNMLSNDVNRFDQVCSMICNLITAPLQALVVMIILATLYLGLWPSVACLGSILIYVLIQSSLGRGFSKIRQLTAMRTDERIRIINELIVAMRIVKMYAWEEPFKRIVLIARRKEMNSIAISSILKTINQTLFFISSKIIVFASLITYILLGYKLDPELVFVAISLANLVRLSLTLFFPTAIAYLAETNVSCRRINRFLSLPEHSRSSLNYKQTNDTFDSKYSIHFSKVLSSWTQDYSRPLLDDVNLSITSGELIMIVGRVASGKSSILMSVLGEAPIISGSIHVVGRISYASQEAWIFPGTVRDNILFGNEYLPDRYKEVVKVCSLTQDLQILPQGDRTFVGERGVSLSGGQKARVNLARALYKQAEIYLLDDPLSAVDAPVARDIFRYAIQGFLSDKIVLLATHQLQFLSNANRILLLEPNQKAFFGTADEVCNSDTFKDLKFAAQAFQDARGAKDVGSSDEKKSSSPRGSPEKRMFSTPTQESERSYDTSKSDETKYNSLSDQVNQESGICREQGGEIVGDISANRDSYLYYISNGSNIIGFLWFVIINILAQLFFQYTDIFLSFWTDTVQRRDESLSASVPFEEISYTDSLSNQQLSLIYTLLVVVSFFAAFFRTATLYTGALIASINIHKRFFSSIMSAPIKFFDFNPIGVLLNRLGRDIGFIDETLPMTWSDVIVIAVNVLGGIIVTIIIDPKNAIASVILLVGALSIRAIISNNIIRLKQLEGVRGGPVFTHLSVSLTGLTTIRAFKAEAQFQSQANRLLDRFSGISFLYICSSRVLSLAIDLLSLSFVSAVVLTSLLLSLDSSSPSSIGLILSQVIMIPGPLQWGMRQLVELESQMTCVQRIQQYSDIDPEESDHDREYIYSLPPPSPPSRDGIHIKFIELFLRYFPDEPPVLKNINLEIYHGEKIGVVGRTGSGKSSIVSCLLRLYPFEGKIEIDGRDTKMMTLRQLRSSISIIPQDPVLFAGTIRKNLDPFGEYEDAQLWSALDAVQLRNRFESNEAKLESRIEESGSNLSIGQRQLVCLARAIIRRNNILIMDEATANVDPETDAFIQATIKREFARCTVITIAHRIITIADSDRVLVLDQRQVAEFEDPKILIQNPKSLFRQMVNSVTPSQGERIRSMIESSAQN